MKYCYNCGVKIEIADSYCDNCGSKQEHESKISIDSIAKDDVVKGVILTDSLSLSRKFNVSQSAILNCIQSYTKALCLCGLKYKIIDCSSYEYANPKSTFLNRTVSLNPKTDSWIKYSQVLTDDYCFTYGDDKPIFLFIIGGDEIIPMPKVANKCYEEGENNDIDIDSDLLYSYLLDVDTFKFIDSSTIYEYTPYYYIGRMPTGNDFTFSSFCNYFDKAQDVILNGGLSIRSAYGQIDKNWMVESEIVSQSISSLNLFPSIYDTLPYELSSDRLIKTPDVRLEHVDQIINIDANLLYFNMHGSDVPIVSEAGYFGESYCGISPKQISSMKQCNILVTEACYGARFINLNNNQSMLLTAISSNTIGFLGSSRIAWGSAVYDHNHADYITNADIICKVFMNASLGGVPLGVALQIAKRALIEKAENLSPLHESSLLEFNLFGDPAIFVNTNSGEFEGKNIVNKCADYKQPKPLTTTSDNLYCNIETVYKSNHDSILENVRNKVDSSFLEIREKISKELYDNYNIEPRSLAFAQRISYKNNNKEYLIYYKDINMSDLAVVISDAKGEVKRVILSK